MNLVPGVWSRSTTAAQALVLAIATAAALAGCEKKIDGPQPAISAIAPHAACNAQIETKVVLTGEGFSPLNDRLLRGEDLELPEVTLVREKDLAGAGTSSPTVIVPDDLSAPDNSDVSWSSQGEMSFRICPTGTCSTATPAGTDYALEPGLYKIDVRNRTGRQTSFSSAIAIVPPPSLTGADNDLLCKDKGNRLTLTGDYLLRLDGKPLSISVGTTAFTPELSDCRTLAAPEGMKLEACRTAAVDIPAGTFSTGTYPIVANGPAPTSCRSTQALSLTFVPEPTVTQVVPDIACLAVADRTFTVRGSGLLSVAGALPSVSVGAASFAASGVSGCAPVTGPNAAVQTCAELTFTVPAAALADGAHDLTVTNPAPADCGSTPPVQLVVVPRPTLASIQPELTCNEQSASTFILTGTGFLEVDGVAPNVALSGPSGAAFASDAGMVAPVAASCSALPGPTETVRTCTSLRLTVPQGALSATGTYQVTVENPNPAGCTTAEVRSVLVVPSPHLTAVAPTPVCTEQGPQLLTLTGTGFLSVDGGSPAVRFVNQTSLLEVAADAGVLPASCAMIDGGGALESCTALLAEVAQNAFTPGATYAAFVDNPAPAACTTPEVVMFQGAAAPAITSLSPLTLCTGGGQLVATGTGFEPDAGAMVGGRLAAAVAVTDELDGGMRVVARFGPGPVGGPFEFSIVNGSGCSAITPAQVDVIQGPLMLFADPRVAWNQMTTPITVFAGNVSPPISKVEIAPAGGPPVALAFTTPNRADRPVAVLPAGADAGVYDVWLTDSTGCPALLSGGLTVVSTTTLTLTSVTPTFGWAGSETDLTVGASQSGTSPGFGPLPRVYLVPVASPTTSIPLRAVDVVSPTALSATAPAGLVAGAYDVVVVNQDGSVGVLPGAFTVTEQPPPSITGVTPAQVTNTAAAQAVVISGANFRGAAGGIKPTVTLRCIDPTGAAITPAQVLPVGTFTATTINTTLDATPYNTGANCLVEVTNADDQTQTQFSSIVIVTAAQNLTNFLNGPSLATGRRGLAAAAGAASQSARFVYALAGDDGANVLSSVEVLPVDIFGKAGPAFFTQRYGLATPRTQTSAARIGRFIYVAGGASAVNASNAALTSVERAVILDATTTPATLDADLEIVPSAQGGLGAGTFYFRVSAVMATSDAFNPGGEGLPSETFGVSLPTLTNFAVQVQLSWTAVPGAAGYRIYRTSANGQAGSERLIADTTAALPAEIVCTSPTACTDTGAARDPSVAPQRIGATGVFSVVANMATPREAPGVTWAADPVDSTKAYLYVFGGLDAARVPLGSYELLPITVGPAGTQTVATSFTPGVSVLSTPRQRLRGYTLTPSDSARTGGKTYVWAGSGSTAVDTSTVDAWDGAELLAGGQLGPFVVAQSLASAGYGAFAAGDFLYALGGTGGVATVDTNSSQLTTTPPLLGGFNSNAPGMNQPRVDLGATIQSGFFYILGGSTTGGAVTATTEYVLY